MKKRTVSGLLCLVMAFVALTTAAGASSYWYTIDTPYGHGDTETLDAGKKEYTQVSVNTDGRQSITVSLYSPKVFGSDTWYGNDQALAYGSGRSAWWYGDTTTNRTYYIKTITNATTMNLSGYFRNC